MNTTILILVAALAALGAIALYALWRSLHAGARSEALDAQMARTSEMISANHSELAGRLAQIAESSATTQTRLTERMHAQELALAKGLETSSTRTHQAMAEVRERLATIDAAQKNITELSSQMVELQEVLGNKQARGAFGEVQLENLVADMLPPSAYQFQATVGSGQRADCLIRLPNPPGPIAVDAKFPLESYHALRAAGDDAARAAAGRTFRTAMAKHIGDISSKYIIPGETAESALMFLPSEAVYAELHGNFPEVVEKSHRARVFIVSPSTLAAMLNTVRAVLKDVRMREQAGVIQTQVMAMLGDVERLDERVGKLQRHFEQAGDDIRKIRTSTEKITKKGQQIGELQLEDGSATAGEEVSTPRLVEGGGQSTGD
jgi:DNA recombination protein RmuC